MSYYSLSPTSYALSIALSFGSSSDFQTVIKNTSNENYDKISDDLFRIEGNYLSKIVEKNWPEVIDVLMSKLSQQVFIDMITKPGTRNPSPLHQMAVKSQFSDLYKRLKKEGVVNPKTCTTFYCESPDFYRKCFKRRLRETPICIVAGEGTERKEEWMPWNEMSEKYGYLFTVKPLYFRHIPYLTESHPSLFDSELNTLRKTKLDAYLLRIKEEGGEKGLMLSDITKDDEGNALPCKVGLGVVTRRAYKKGDMVCLYGGSKVDDLSIDFSKPIPDNSYRIAYELNSLCFDGIHHRAFGSMIPHGFPNTSFESVHTGLGEFRYIEAIDDISPGTVLAIDYGRGYAGTNEFAEIRPKAYKEKLAAVNAGESICYVQKRYLQSTEWRRH